MRSGADKGPSLLKYFKDEIKEQLKGGKSKQPPRQL
jgi:hypothetical protein